jgi:endonuclease IV
MTPIIYIGAHINREKTIVKTMEAITKNGGNCLQLFVSNPRSASLVTPTEKKNETRLFIFYIS